MDTIEYNTNLSDHVNCHRRCNGFSLSLSLFLSVRFVTRGHIVECQDDSVVYMGDDDCCVMDVSNNISLVELDVNIDSMDQLNLE